ncbi:hypothetical protein J6590_042586 [Homalodisca vitripennis]|nr:hypothetical protein J6590_042586 [Homalodisca vitripennis]
MRTAGVCISAANIHDEAAACKYALFAVPPQEYCDDLPWVAPGAEVGGVTPSKVKSASMGRGISHDSVRLSYGVFLRESTNYT